MTLQQLLKQARKESGLTQLTLANKVGVQKSYISNIENGNQSVSTDKAAEILAAIGYELKVEYSVKNMNTND